MNRRQRRAETTFDRKPLDRAEVIRFACDPLGKSSDQTLTGATLIMLDGSMTYLSADHARVLHETANTGGRG